MPAMLPPEFVRFELHGADPVLRLAVDPPADLRPEQWSLISRLTLCVVDGPGEAGYLTPRLGPQGDVAPAGWDEAVDRAGGSQVVFGAGADAPAVFVRSL
ncbi:hypothetical protein ACGFI9_02460 [Micromonospora sp. NPDC048930]|uniref:hypothetical protein n=1 Tax=Micromonospora sp. NPDC048930 TaxID=3364261 RepID=UPI003717202F